PVVGRRRTMAALGPRHEPPPEQDGKIDRRADCRRGDRRSTIRGREATVVAPLPRALAEDHHRQRPQHDLQVVPHGPLLDVLEIELDLPLDVLDRPVVVLVDLSPARDAGTDTLTLRVALDLRPELLEDRGLFRPRADDVHVADQHVEELGQLIQSVLAEDPPDRRDTTVVRRGPQLTAAVRVDPHRPELVDPEQAPPVIDTTPGARIRG